MYIFIACDEKLRSFAETLQDEQIKSYNELLAMGMTDKQIQLRGHDFSKLDRDAKVFLIMLPDELTNSPLVIEPDFQNAYARYVSDKRYIYRVEHAQQALVHFVGYIGKYAGYWKELELWCVNEDDYTIDVASIAQRTVYVQQELSSEPFETFFEKDEPQVVRFIIRS